jgi:hypothetical protein
MRALGILVRLYLALVWLIVPYPYGLWLFALSACGFDRWYRISIANCAIEEEDKFLTISRATNL